jgi:hypothetical protein
VCGAAASGNYVWNNPEQVGQLLLCCLMSGPLLTGYTQTINDYYDREIDAINEPYRPIPSGERPADTLPGWLPNRDLEPPCWRPHAPTLPRALPPRRQDQ